MDSMLERWVRVRVPDDRGALVSPAWIDGLANLAPRSRRLPPLVFNAAKGGVWRLGHWRAWAIVATLGVCTGLCVLPGMVVSRKLGYGIPAMMLVTIVSTSVSSLMMAFAVFLPMTRRIYARELLRIVIRHGHCPSCGYDLRALKPQEDLCTLCPECGGAWKLPTQPTELGTPGAR